MDTVLSGDVLAVSAISRLVQLIAISLEVNPVNYTNYKQIIRNNFENIYVVIMPVKMISRPATH